MEQHKRTFSEYFDIMLRLDLRAIKVNTKFMLLQCFYPWRALFVRHRFKRTLKMIHELKIHEAKKGYWI